MKILIGFEYSGTVRDAFISRGHEAISCDILPTEKAGPHYQCCFFDLDHSSYDLIIAHPPCTAVCVSGNRHYSGTQARIDGIRLIDRVWQTNTEKLCIENPVGVINSFLSHMPKPYYVQPYEHGHGETKRTGLWTRGLPRLVPSNPVKGRVNRIHMMPPSRDRGKLRSRTYPGIAAAMAEQWG